MICSVCEQTFPGIDYICPRCRHNAGMVTNRVVAVYEDDGYNQWGTKYHSVCSNCEAEYPANMYGMGICRACGVRQNPMERKS